MYMCVYVCVRVGVGVGVYVCGYVCGYMCVCVCMCVSVRMLGSATLSTCLKNVSVKIVSFEKVSVDQRLSHLYFKIF